MMPLVSVPPLVRCLYLSTRDPVRPPGGDPDVRLAVGLADQAEIGVRIGPATDTLLSAVIDTGRPWPDFSAVIEALNAP